jgi:N-methylhydantoinase A/oxoprolinase/acetone carboxylase beta subunit
VAEVPTTPASPAAGVGHGLRRLAASSGPPASIAHGTTVVTDAIVERRGATVGLITT